MSDGLSAAFLLLVFLVLASAPVYLVYIVFFHLPVFVRIMVILYALWATFCH